MKTSEHRSRRRAVFGLALILSAGVVVWLSFAEHLTAESLSERHGALLLWRDAHGPFAVALFFVATALAALVSLPGIAVFTLAAGLLFGWLWGTVLVALAATLGATGLFLLVRAGLGTGLTRRTVARIEAGEAGRVAAALKAHEIKTLLILRMAPVVPFFLANTLPAAVGVPLHRFVLTTLVGILPGTAAIAVAGVGIGDMAAKGSALPSASLLGALAVAAALLILSGMLAMRLRQGA